MRNKMCEIRSVTHVENGRLVYQDEQGLLDYMKSRSLSTSIILITGHPYLLADKGLEGLACFMKPFNMYDLLHKVEEMLGE